MKRILCWLFGHSWKRGPDGVACARCEAPLLRAVQ